MDGVPCRVSRLSHWYQRRSQHVKRHRHLQSTSMPFPCWCLPQSHHQVVDISNRQCQFQTIAISDQICVGFIACQPHHSRLVNHSRSDRRMCTYLVLCKRPACSRRRYMCPAKSSKVRCPATEAPASCRAAALDHVGSFAHTRLAPGQKLQCSVQVKSSLPGAHACTMPCWLPV
jgi:hypothetical protein